MVPDPRAAPRQPQTPQHCGSSGAPQSHSTSVIRDQEISSPGPYSTTGLPSAHPNRGKPQELVLEGDFTGTHQTPCPPQLMGVLGAKGKATELRAKPWGWLHQCRQRAQCLGSPCQALSAHAG